MDKIYYNGNIITMKSEDDIQQAVHIIDEKIKLVGSNDLVLANKNKDTELIDLDGKTMLPSLIDPHSHFIPGALTAGYVNLAPAPIGEVKNFDDIVCKLKQGLDSLAPGGILIGLGYDQNELEEGCHPTRDLLDQVSTEIPILCVQVSLHIAVTNSKGLELCEIDENTPDPYGGSFGRYPGGTKPNGILEENGFIDYRPIFLKTPSTDELIRDIKKWQTEYVSNGYTTVQDGGLQDDHIGIYKLMAAENILDIDVKGYMASNQKKWQVEYKINDTLGRMHIAGRKYWLDGSPQGRTAFMLDPYKVVNNDDDPEYRGVSRSTDEELITFMLDAIKENISFLIHCNGDAASEQFIRCYEEALKIQKPTKELRPVMIHSQLLLEEQMDRMKDIGIYPSFFSVHVLYFGDTHIINFGFDRAKLISAAKYASKIGLNYTDHQDSPVVPPKPWRSIDTMVNRMTKSDVLLNEDYRLTVYEALKAYTINGAWQYFEEDKKGTIESGKLADLIIIDRNPYDIDSMDLKNVKVVETLKEGKVIYKLHK